jgi:hypothetical protein
MIFSSPEETPPKKTLKTTPITLFLHFAFASSAHTESVPHYLSQISRICLERLRKRCEILLVQPASQPSINFQNES